jgi:uncharacterized protein YndB with AHSA1/START domain
MLEFEPHGDGGAIYRATAIHKDAKDAESHEQMGFSQGWSIVLDQLVSYVKSTPLT